MAVLSKLTSDLPDLAILAIISQMNLEDRLNAHQVCPSWCYRVREVNRVTVPWLIILVSSQPLNCPKLDHYLNLGTLANEHKSAKLLTRFAQEEPKNNSPLPFFCAPLVRHTQWNCLKFEHDKLTSAVVLKILATFSGTTELTILLDNSAENTWSLDQQTDLSCLLTMLISDKRGNWKDQLTTFQVLYLKAKNYFADIILGTPFYEALNHYTVLKNLTLYHVYLNHHQELPILRQLQRVMLSFLKDQYYETAFRSIKQYGLGNETTSPLQVHLPEYDPHFYNSLLKRLDADVCNTFFLLENSVLHNQGYYWKVLGGICPNLVSISLFCFSKDLPRIFSEMSHNLPNLFHLRIIISFSSVMDDRGRNMAILPGPVGRMLTVEKQLSSVQALDLELKLSKPDSHDQARWLNIGHLMPNLKSVHLNSLVCSSCNSVSDVKARKLAFCCRDLLKIVAYSTGLPSQRITYQGQDIFGPTEQIIGF